jgi:2',3'-cyclic-nucleotide 2'-phosphodiesterase (5'-nucleotidase family)
MTIRFRPYILFFLCCFLLPACGNINQTHSIDPELPKDSTISDGSNLQAQGSDVLTLTVLYTNDEHGWMEGVNNGTGAAELAGLWENNYSDSDAILTLSGGDNWTGPAISTWFEGEGMVETMNAMDYTASALGNHEFDFGLDVLKERTAQANYPFLGANIRYKSNSSIPTDLGIQPYVIVDVAGLKIGVIGLANVDTPSTTNPKNVADLVFLDYAETLREYVPEVWSAGADLIFVPSHLCTWELAPLARDVKDLGITLFGGGHCHEEYSELIVGSVILSGGSYFNSYAFATFEIDISNVEILDADFGVVENTGGVPHPQVADIVDNWSVKAADELNIVIGYSDNEISQRSEEMAALITKSWLLAYPADVALTNWGGMRDRIPPGEITISSIISVMPFENVLIDVELTGRQLKRVLSFGGGLPPVSGVHYAVGQWVFDKTGEPIDPDASFSLLVTDYLYAGGADYTMLAEYDPEGYNTAISWRQPIIDWILAQYSDVENPIDWVIE